MPMSWLVRVMSWIFYRCGDKSDVPNSAADESLFSQYLVTGRSGYQHAAHRWDRTDDGEGRGQGGEADPRGCFK